VDCGFRRDRDAGPRREPPASAAPNHPGAAKCSDFARSAEAATAASSRGARGHASNRGDHGLAPATPTDPTRAAADATLPRVANAPWVERRSDVRLTLVDLRLSSTRIIGLLGMHFAVLLSSVSAYADDPPPPPGSHIEYAHSDLYEGAAYAMLGVW